jgi:hypothetical protein
LQEQNFIGNSRKDGDRQNNEKKALLDEAYLKPMVLSTEIF